MQNGKILVTGGAGYIGAHACVALHKAGFQPIILDDFSNSERSVIDRLEQLMGTRPKVLEVDCTDVEALSDAVLQEGSFEGIIHFAAFKSVNESVANPGMYYHNNLRSMLAVLEVMRKHKINNLVFSSSCTVYGQPEQNPVTETTPFMPPSSPYGATKQMCEQIICDHSEAYDAFNITMLRYFNPIGADPSGLIGELPLGTPNNLVPYITQTAAGIREQLVIFGDDYNTTDGTCIRDFIHVSDLADAHVAALKQLKPGVQVFNLGTGKGHTVFEVVKTFEEVNDLKLNYVFGPRRPGDIEQIFASTEKAEKGLDWSCNYTLADALQHAWNWQEQLKDR